MTEQNIPIYRRGVEDVVKKSLDEYGRAKWDVEQVVYDKQERDDQEYDENNPRYTKSLQARTDSVGIDEIIGKKRIVVKEGQKQDMSGFYCELCDVITTDSNSWLDHLNSEMHNRLLGMNMKVDRVTVSDVKDKLSQVKEMLQQKNKQQTQNEKQQSIDEIRKELEEQLLKKKQKKIKKQQTKQKTQEIQQIDDEEGIKLKQFLSK